jgi:hypothetical protein
MVDQAYGNWQSDIQSGNSSILIAADNDTVSILNERAQADLVIQGFVDAEQTVLLSDGLHAGRGDTIIVRHNDRTIWDSNGDFIRNGTMFDVGRVGKRDGSLVAVRRETGGVVTLPRDYVQSAVELGYATTAHRSQGLTVDTGHTVVTQGRLTRELLYVSMTRGRIGNHAYVSQNDPLDHDPLDPSVQPSWREILGEVLAAEGAERSAHEIRVAERSKADSLERLSAEYDYLAQIAAAEDLVGFLRARTPERASEIQQSPSWGPTVAAWRRCSGVSRPSAQRLVVETFESSSSARDLASVIHSRLRGLLSRLPSDGFTTIPEVLHASRSDLRDMIRQVAERMRRRADDVAQAALLQETEWKQDLLECLGREVQPEEARRLVREVALFRDWWGVEDSPLALGPLAPDYEWEQKSQRASIERRISQAALPSSATPQQHGAWMEEPRQREASLINVGWQL